MIHFAKVNGFLVQLEQVEDEKGKSLLGEILGALVVFTLIGIITVLSFTF